MKKQLIAATVSLAGALPLWAHAQASNFEGFSVGLSATSADTTTEYRHGGSTKSSTNTDNNAVLQIQFNTAVNEAFVMGIGATANLSDLKAGNNFKVSDSFSLYVAPGLAFSGNWLGYGKLAYLNSNVQGNGISQRFDNGYGYGLGVQGLFGKNWFGQFEYMVNQYDDRAPGPGDSLKLKSNIYSLTAGYKF